MARHEPNSMSNCGEEQLSTGVRQKIPRDLPLVCGLCEQKGMMARSYGGVKWKEAAAAYHSLSLRVNF